MRIGCNNGNGNKCLFGAHHQQINTEIYRNIATEAKYRIGLTVFEMSPDPERPLQ